MTSQPVIGNVAEHEKKVVIGNGESDAPSSNLESVSTAWSYVVVSSEQQNETLEDQARWARDVAAANGWTITRSFSGVSTGKDGVRKLLEDLLAELRSTPKAQRPQRVLTIRIDRLGRGDGLEAMGALAQIRRLGVILHTRTDGDVRLERATDSILPAIMAITAGIENEVRSEKWRAVHARRRAAGLHVGQVPFGVVLVDGRAVPYEPEASIVRAVFKHAADDHWGYTRLATFARERAPSKRLNDGSDRAYRWAPATIRTLMNSKTLRGLVVDEDLWERARSARALDFRARAPRRFPWPLRGAVRCTCGRLLRGHTGGVEGWKIRYLFCSDPCHSSPHPAHRADKLEQQFVELLRQLWAQDDFVVDKRFADDAMNEAQQLLKSARKAASAAEERRSRVWALAEEGQITGVQLRERLDEVDAARKVASADLAAAERSIVEARASERSLESANAILSQAPAIWESADAENRAAIARLVAALPEIGGLFCDPGRKNVLLCAADLPENSFCSNKGKSDDSITKKFIQSITE
ncbi:MAG TPA: recombinase family protein [Candidatus Tumulicola sp.]